jgi:hypothetical protein
MDFWALYIERNGLLFLQLPTSSLPYSTILYRTTRKVRWCAKKGIPKTPAMTADIGDHVWSVRELLEAILGN